MSQEPGAEDKPVPVTCFTGFLGAGKTSTILSLLKRLPKDYKCVLVKNEYGDVEGEPDRSAVFSLLGLKSKVDSLLASQSNITGVSEILNGCLCCTMVGLVENAMLEIKEKFKPDRILIESSGSAFPATLALQIRQLEPKGFKLDGVVTVIDCVNFKGYEDTSPSAKLQAKYTDLLLLSKHQLCTERELDILSDTLGELNEDTPRIKIGPEPENPLDPELLFGLDTKLFELKDGERVDWENVGGKPGDWHGDEVETRTVWTGRKPGTGKGKEKATHVHAHAEGEACACEDDAPEDGFGLAAGEVKPVERSDLEAQLGKLSFEIYRVKGLVRLKDGSSPKGWTTHILNYAFSRFDLTPAPSLDNDDDLAGTGLRLTVMGERGEVARRAKRFAEALGAQCA